MYLHKLYLCSHFLLPNCSLKWQGTLFEALDDDQPENKKQPKSMYTRFEVDKKRGRKLFAPLKQIIINTMDFHLLKSCSFFLFTLSGALQMCALLIVYIYEKGKNSKILFKMVLDHYYCPFTYFQPYAIQ